MQLYIIVVVVFASLILIFWIIGRFFSEKIMTKVKLVLKNTFWNGMIMSLQISCFKHCIVISNQIRMQAMGSKFQKPSEITTAFLMLAILIALSIYMIYFLITRKERLETEDLKEKCGIMYSHASLNRDFPMVLKFPISVLQRVFYMVLAGLFYKQNYMSL